MMTTFPPGSYEGGTTTAKYDSDSQEEDNRSRANSWQSSGYGSQKPSPLSSISSDLYEDPPTPLYQSSVSTPTTSTRCLCRLADLLCNNRAQVLNKLPLRTALDLMTRSKLLFNDGVSSWRGGLKGKHLILQEGKRFVPDEDDELMLLEEEFLCRRMHLERLELKDMSPEEEGEQLAWLVKMRINCSQLIVEDVSEGFALRAAELLKPVTFNLRQNKRGNTILDPKIMQTPFFRDIKNIAIHADNSLDLDFPTQKHQSIYLISETALIPDDLASLIRRSVAGTMVYDTLRMHYRKTESDTEIVRDWCRAGVMSIKFLWNYPWHAKSCLKDVDQKKLRGKNGENYFCVVRKERVVAIRTRNAMCLLKIFPSLKALKEEICTPGGF